MKNLQQLLDAIKEGTVEMSEELPTFGGEEPKRTLCVWSWDRENLLVGECADDLRIVTREDWAN